MLQSWAFGVNMLMAPWQGQRHWILLGLKRFQGFDWDGGMLGLHLTSEEKISP